MDLAPTEWWNKNANEICNHRIESRIRIYHSFIDISQYESLNIIDS